MFRFVNNLIEQRNIKEISILTIQSQEGVWTSGNILVEGSSVIWQLECSCDSLSKIHVCFVNIFFQFMGTFTHTFQSWDRYRQIDSCYRYRYFSEIDSRYRYRYFNKN